ncbi:MULTISPECIES: hypothetical protein [Chryseobacterium]|uniref:Uncharacterized protein n=1 Tax=Chryseobacterium camelliae TaxID=1265445 RepID=A0ABU0TIM6_9FLAO|nr:MULTISPECIES: hypothetical protein [Chryseobacterium]MDQ1100853.1 hypothetical protein [Chryseobacterium sp. SORGH_AS_1048]MDR6132566.1 hypothetical protein [Chryseobacterium sp. SORGH_AS_1175]MDT3409227.1 hypothetical protein [Pseudacidovorax intermedius]MDQ1096911.1 hypothetical protein [Chryseobacterium camelliae]MDR6084295.1 hypothetical protein [Chryseobacterium sp. SORGH_AS_0909]
MQGPETSGMGNFSNWEKSDDLLNGSRIHDFIKVGFYIPTIY